MQAFADLSRALELDPNNEEALQQRGGGSEQCSLDNAQLACVAVLPATLCFSLVLSGTSSG